MERFSDFVLTKIIIFQSFLLDVIASSAVLCWTWPSVMLTLWKSKPKYELVERKPFLQSSCQSKRPWFSFVPEIFVSTNCHNYRHDVVGDWRRENNRIVNCPFVKHFVQSPFIPIEWHTEPVDSR